MFTHSKLINTPSKSGVTVTRGHEFTPIGGKSRSALEPLSHIDNYSHSYKKDDKYNRPLFRPLRENNRDNDAYDQNIMDSSFDQTTDNFNESYNVFTKPQKDIYIDQNRPKNSHLIDENMLINNGASSIKEQEIRSRELERENYNLKIKLATLQRFYDQTPEEQQELLSENILLKRRLAESLEELDGIKRPQVNLHNNEESSQNLDFEMKIKELHSEYKEIIEEKDRALSQNSHRVEMLEKELNDINRVHGNERQFANQEVNNLINDSKKEIDQLNNEINHLKASNQKLRLTNNVLQEEVSELKSDRRQLQEKIESLKLDLAKSNHELDLIESKHMADKDLIDEDQHRLSQIQNEVKYWKQEYNSLKSEIGNREHEIEDLKFQIKEYKEKVGLSRDTLNEHQLKLERFTEENKLLNKRIMTLEENIKQREDEEFRLRDQISNLLRDKQNNDNSKYYEQEIRSLRKKEDELNNKISLLTQDLENTSKVNNSSNSEKINKLQEQVFEQKNRISFYETEYEKLEKEFENSKAEISRKESKLNDNKRRIDTLQEEIQFLEQQLEGKSNNSALLELESMSRKKIETERAFLEESNKKLNEEIESMSYNLKALQRELDNERRLKNDSFSNSEYEALLRRYNELQDTLKENEINYRRKIQEVSNFGINHTGISNINNSYEIEYHKVLLENHQLQNRIKELEIKLMTDEANKNMTIQKLERKIYEINNNINEFDNEKTDLIRQSSEKELKLKKLERELENITKDHQNDISYYKDRISNLEKKMKENIHKDGEDSIQLLLEVQLEDVKRLKTELSKKLNEIIQVNESLADDVKLLKEENENYSQLVSKYEKQEKVLKLDTNKLEIQNKSLIAEEKKLNGYIEKLVEKIKQLKSKEYSNNRVDLNHQLSNLSLTSKHQQEIRLLSNELKYYKAKLYDINMKANDLQLMYSLVTGSIKNSNDLIKSDIRRLKEIGLYNESRASNDIFGLRKKNHSTISFRVLAKFVLASVRLKNRYEKSTSRKLTLLELKNSIESDKIELIS